MTANELRIGNYHETEGLEIPKWAWSSVKIGGKSFSAITSYGIHLVDQWETTGEGAKFEFKPIPLTEEWLERFGLGDTVDFRRDFQDGELSFDEGTLYLSKYYGTFQFPCKYVHQLQNLFFALTGEELTVKETKEA